MKTIELTDEQYQFLVDAQEAIKTQDNRCTANPIYYYKYTDYLPTSIDFEESHAIRNPDSTESWDSDEHFIEHILEYHQEFADALLEAYQKEQNNEKLTLKDLAKHFLDARKTDYWDEATEFTKWFIGNTVDGDDIIDKLMDEYTDELTGYDYIPTMKVERNYDSGCFSLFEKDLEYHKNQNKHNFRKNTYSYAGSIQRTPMMLDLMKLLKEVKL